jgi:hypothetical protein
MLATKHFQNTLKDALSSQQTQILTEELVISRSTTNSAQ